MCPAGLHGEDSAYFSWRDNGNIDFLTSFAFSEQMLQIGLLILEMYITKQTNNPTPKKIYWDKIIFCWIKISWYLVVQGLRMERSGEVTNWKCLKWSKIKRAERLKWSKRWPKNLKWPKSLKLPKMATVAQNPTQILSPCLATLAPEMFKNLVLFTDYRW